MPISMSIFCLELAREGTDHMLEIKRRLALCQCSGDNVCLRLSGNQLENKKRKRTIIDGLVVCSLATVQASTKYPPRPSGEIDKG